MPDELVARVEKYMPGIGPKLRPILQGLTGRGCDANEIVEAILEAWNAAFPESLRRGLVGDAIPGTARCDAALARFDTAARELLALTELPDDAAERPALAAQIEAKLRELQRVIQQLHDKTADVLSVIGAEVRDHRFTMGHVPKGRPKAWFRRADQALVAARVPVRTRRELLRLVAEHMGLEPHYRRAQK